jgi:dihydroneopterin aldolase
MLETMRSYERIALREVTVDVRIGVRDAERQGPQPVVVDVELYRHRRGFPPGGTLEDCLDYDRLYRHLVEDWPERPHTDLLERLAEDLVAFCLEDGRVEACRVRLRKPAIYAGRAIPEIELWRRREDTSAES